MTPESFDTLRRDLVRDDALCHTAYQDARGYWTIGVGRLIDSRKGGGLPTDEALYLLTNDILRVRAELQRTVPTFDTLDPVRQRVLINMGFNLGLSAFKGFRQMLAAVAVEDFAAASRAMLDSTWARQVGNRAKRLAAEMRTGGAA
jgi:lysozyme